jgi:hypothetical protein
MNEIHIAVTLKFKAVVSLVTLKYSNMFMTLLHTNFKPEKLTLLSPIKLRSENSFRVVLFPHKNH